MVGPLLGVGWNGKNEQTDEKKGERDRANMVEIGRMCLENEKRSGRIESLVLSTDNARIGHWFTRNTRVVTNMVGVPLAARK